MVKSSFFMSSVLILSGLVDLSKDRGYFEMLVG